MNLDLSDEQTWLAESVETLLEREWVDAAAAWEADAAARERLWQALAEFGALGVGTGEDGLGLVELCLVSRAMGGGLGSAPLIGSSALRWAIASFAAELPPAFLELLGGTKSVGLALLEPNGGWSVSLPAARLDGAALGGRKVSVEHFDTVDHFAVMAAADAEPVLALVPRAAPGVTAAAQAAFDPSVPVCALDFDATPVADDAVLDGELASAVIERLMRVGGLLVEAEAVGAAARLFADACDYARERRQFGHPIGSYQALRHLLADLYVRHASAWSTLLYAAATLDEDEADIHTASIAKAYAARAAREVAHGAMQVFGGISFTAEHPAHRYLRRIVVRERQFGDAAYHERALGRALASVASCQLPVASAGAAG